MLIKFRKVRACTELCVLAGDVGDALPNVSGIRRAVLAQLLSPTATDKELLAQSVATAFSFRRTCGRQ